MTDDTTWRAAPPVEPLCDTWGVKALAGFWCITPSFAAPPLSTLELNAWFTTAVHESLEAFAHVTRAWRVSGATIAEPNVAPVALERERQESCEAYLQRVHEAIHDYPAPLYAVEVKVDVFAYFRTPESRTRPMQGWARLGDNFRIWAVPEHQDVGLCFNVRHTLFNPFSQDGEDNYELYALNQPLLETALRGWEQKFGPITDFEGQSGIYHYGFSTNV